MHVLTSIYGTLYLCPAINKLLSYFTDTSPSGRFQRCGQLILKAENLKNLLRGQPRFGLKVTDIINEPNTTMILIKSCPCSRKCIKTKELIVRVCVNGKQKKFKITECKICSQK